MGSERRKMVEYRRLKRQLAMTQEERRAKNVSNILNLLDLLRDEVKAFDGDLTKTREMLKEEVVFFLAARQGKTRVEVARRIDDYLEDQN